MHHDQAIELLRERGCRLTPQRLLVLNIVGEGGGHMGVDEVFRLAKQSYPYIDIATVYRNLHLFKKLGVVTEVAIEDRLHFELTDPNGRHHHMVCQSCGGAFNLDPTYLEEFRVSLVQELGFEANLDNFTIEGMCSACRVKSRGENDQSVDANRR